MRKEQEPTALFESFDRDNSDWPKCFSRPIFTFTAYTLAEVVTAVRLVERETAAGRWAVLLLSYEAAPAFDAAFRVHDVTDFPLAWVASFDEPDEPPPDDRAGEFACAPWQSLMTRDRYDEAIASIRRHIEEGNTYQVNFSFPLKSTLSGSSLAWFRSLGRIQGARYCAYLDLGNLRVLSLSPELFFERKGNRLRSRPMKGTAPRGRWSEEDDELGNELQKSEKNRAENLMIVDLIRNDLGKISASGSVEVTSLFEVERFRTIHQMTSTVESIIRQGVGLWELLQALFPCGSITGAPKIRTMEIIRQLETGPRRAYTGAIGYVKPGGDCVFNVAIRTVVANMDSGDAIAHVGGGITYDSTPAGEFDECLTKAKYLTTPEIEFELLETMLVEEGRIFLLEEHIWRMRSSASYFDFRFDEERARDNLTKTVSGLSGGQGKIRLLLSQAGDLRTQLETLEPIRQGEYRVRLAASPIDRKNLFLYHKTTNRSIYQAALAEKGDADDVLLWNEDGEMTESTIANLVIEAEGRLYTPPQSSGLLRGTFRDHLLTTGRVQERVITRDQLKQATTIYLINSVRKWIPAKLVE